MEPRKEDILKAVVREFTVSATPVGSQALASRYFLNLSSATIRNELSELELGLIPGVLPRLRLARRAATCGFVLTMSRRSSSSM